MSKEFSRKDFIELLRKNGFNCFPIPENTKVADSRYQAERTVLDQVIGEEENYGYIPIKGKHTAIIDLDDKKRYRRFAEDMIKEGYMVIETPHGWHVPVKGLASDATKIELFDYKVQDTKLVEIQGIKHYCVGIGSKIKDEETNKILSYENKGSLQFWDVKGKDFHELIDSLCKQLSLEPREKTSNSSYANLRKKFLEGKIPTKGQSNDYFNQAPLQCNSDGLTIHEAIEKIRIIYDEWAASKFYSDRSWSNVEGKINEVYAKDSKLPTGRPLDNSKTNRAEIVEKILKEKDLYSDIQVGELYENKNGFLEVITKVLRKELLEQYPQLGKPDYDDIIFKLVGRAPDLPETNKELIVFKNGVFDRTQHKIIETKDIADLGFRKYDYLKPNKKNFPKRFFELLFENSPEHEYPRIKAGLRAIFQSYVDPRISVIHGDSQRGKSTALTILGKILGDYALPIELDLLLGDQFSKANIIGKRIIILQDLPKEWKYFAKIKALTGEQEKSERGFHKDLVTFDNKVKIWGSANHCSKIPEHEKNAMYTRRLSLVHNIRPEPYPDTPTIIDDILKEEGEKILSWIINLKDKECEYEDSNTVKKEWEELASPEVEYIEKYYELGDTETDHSIVKIIKHFKEITGKIISIKEMNLALVEQGFIVRWNIVKNLLQKDLMQKSEVLV